MEESTSNIPIDPQKWLTISQAAELKDCDISRQAIKKACQRGRIGKKYAGIWWISRNEFLQYLNNRKIGRPSNDWQIVPLGVQFCKKSSLHICAGLEDAYTWWMNLKATYSPKNSITAKNLSRLSTEMVVRASTFWKIRIDATTIIIFQNFSWGKVIFSRERGIVSLNFKHLFLSMRIRIRKRFISFHPFGEKVLQ